jgi:DNA-binding MltR family transcriptional regulator
LASSAGAENSAVTDPLPDLPEPDEISDVIKDLIQHTQTATAVSLASRMENWIEFLLKEEMPNLSSRLTERLFTGYGPLSSFSGKIDISFALGLIPQETYADLRAIKDIRNCFAHSKEVLHFRRPELAPIIQKLNGWSKDKDPQTLFAERCAACVEQIKVSLEPAIRRRTAKLISEQAAALRDKSA